MSRKKVQQNQTINVAEAELTGFKKYKWQAFFVPVDPSSVVFFRILFGAIMCWEMIRYFKKEWIDRYWIEPGFHFYYWPFDFLQPLPGNGMFVLCALLAILAFFIMIGFLYRIVAVLFFIGFTYTYLLEQARYLNHFYLVILISFIMIFIPANRGAAKAGERSLKNTAATIPAWPVWVLRFTIALPFFWGGIAKINSDWLMGEPMRSWLSYKTDFPVIGRFFTEEWMVYIFSYTGMLFDLLIIPLLLIRRTRKWAFIASVGFNIINARLFTIGIFPWFMLAGASIYFHPSWPRKILNSFIPDKNRMELRSSDQWTKKSFTKREKIILAALLTWALIHILLPLRHFLIPGNVHWTEQGHKYAWHMKLRSKKGKAVFMVRDKTTGEEFVVHNRDYLTSWQEKKMAAWPNLIWQFAQLIKTKFQENGRDVAVYADVEASLNGREYQQLIDHNIDLAAEPRLIFSLPEWIIPLNTPLKKRSGYARDDMDE